MCPVILIATVFARIPNEVAISTFSTEIHPFIVVNDSLLPIFTEWSSMTATLLPGATMKFASHLQFWSKLSIIFTELADSESNCH